MSPKGCKKQIKGVIYTQKVFGKHFTKKTEVTNE